MKGMQVIEIIFILIIMIIVTVVLINMFTEMMGGGKQSLSSQLNDIENYQMGQEAKRTCRNLCTNFQMARGSDSAAVEYCLKAVSVDVSGDGVINDVDKGTFKLIALPPGQDNVCEEHIYCPMIGGAECAYGNRRLTMMECKKTLCRFYEQQGLTPEQSARKIAQYWQLGSCDIQDEPNWGGWIGSLCGTDINITGAKGAIAPQTGNDNSGGGGNGNNGGSPGVCEEFCDGAVYEGVTYTQVAVTSSGKLSGCVNFLTCMGAGSDAMVFPAGSADANGRPVPCGQDEEGNAEVCCCTR